jgi:TonB family protein
VAAPRDSEPKYVPGAGDGVVWFGWAGNERLLAARLMTVLIAGNGMFGIVPMRRLSAFDVKTDKPLDLDLGLGPLGNQVVYTDPDGRFILAAVLKGMETSPSVERVDLATGAKVEVQPKRNDIWSWFADKDGNVRGGIAYGNDGKGFTIYYRETPQGELRKVGKTRIDLDVSAVDGVTIVPGASKGVIVTNAVTGRFGVYELSLGETGGIGAPIFEHPTVDVKDVKFSGDGTTVEGVSYEDERPHVKWLTPELEAIQGQLDRTFPGKENRIVDRSRDGNIVLIWSGGADDPGTYYVFDRRARRMNVFASPYDRLVEKNFAPVKPIRYTARDGLSIPAYLTLPPGRDPRSLPLIVMPHGGPFARDSYEFDPWVQFLAGRGYAVLQPEFRGSTGYGRGFVEKGYGAWGTAMQDDLDDGVADLVRQGIADPKRICLMGASYGGYAALWGAIRNPETYRCAISFAGVTDLRAMIDWDTTFLIPSRYVKWWRQRVEGEKKRDLGAVSPLKQAARLHVPVLIAHGGRDINVPFSQGRDMAAALKASGAPVYFASFPSEGHGFDKYDDSLEFLRRVDAFLAIHNPSDLPPPRGPRDAERLGGSVGAADYPAGSASKKEKGKAELSFTIGRDGRVSGCRAEKSSSFPKLDKLACDLVEQRFQYWPALGADGSPVESRGTYSVDWGPAPVPALPATPAPAKPAAGQKG